MRHEFTMEYWLDDGWYVGRLREMPDVFSQGETIRELEENIRDAYALLRSDADVESLPPQAQNRPIEVEV